MNFGLPPTDNLYKFISVSGLLLILGCGVGLSYHVNVIKERDLELLRVGYRTQYDVERLVKLTNARHHVKMAEDSMYKSKLAEFSSLTPEQKTHKSSINFYLLQRKREVLIRNMSSVTDVSASGLEELARYDAAIEEQIALRKNESLLVEFRIINEEREYYKSKRRLAYCFYGAGVVFGGILLLFGVGVWYKRQQRYEDIVLSIRAKKDASG